MQTLTDWLRSLGLEQYGTVFEKNGVDLEALRLLSDDDLQELGLLLGHRRKLLKALADQGESPLTSADDARPVSATSMFSQPQEMPSAGERRQLTVLFCDLVGFTELASRLDPELLQKIIQTYEDACAVCITRYEGYVFQRLGDGIVAFFGYPLAHEGEAERAIHAGLAILESLSTLRVPEAGQLSVRIGIATGLVVVSSAEKGAVGETMNLASRLQGIAAVNTLVVSERVRRLAAGAFNYEDLGEQALKGITSPTRAFRVAGVSQALSRFEAATQAGLTAFVGREQEVGLLLDRWQLSREGESQVVLLSGEAGIGKSRILSTLRERLEGEGAQTLRYQCSPYHVNSAYYPIVQHVERALAFERDDTPEARLTKLETFLVTVHQRPAMDVRLLGALLSLPVEARYGGLQMSPQKQKDETLRALVDWMESAASKRPALLLFEDLHWADPTSLEVLSLLVDRVRATPLLSVFTHRPEFQIPWMSHGHMTSLNLSKLSRAQSAAMIHALANHKALPGDLLEKILSRTDGIPLFVEELTKAILESKELDEKSDRYEYQGDPAKLIIPATLRDSLMARLDRNQAMKEVAQMGAAIGREFSHELIEAVAPMRKEQLGSALSQLTNAGLAHRRGTPPEATYTFKHALVQDAAYDSLLKSQRQALHRRIAGVIENRFQNITQNEPEVLAHHFIQGALAERAVPYWILAGQRTLGRVALAEAIAHLTTALSAMEQLPACAERDRTELEARVLLGSAHLMHGGWATIELPRALGPARALAKRLGETTKLALVLYPIWVHHAMRCEYPSCLKLYEEIDLLARSNEDSVIFVLARSTEALTLFWTGNFVGAQRATERLSQAYDVEKHGHLVHILGHDLKSLALGFAGRWLYALGYPDRARQATMDQLELSQHLGHAFDLCWALTGGASGLLLRGETSLARQWAAQARAIALEHALKIMELQIVAQAEGEAAIIDGDYADGYRNENQTTVLWRGQGGVVNLPSNNAYLARALMGLKRFDEAKVVLDEAIEIVDRTGHRADEAEVHRVMGELLRRQPVPDADAAERAFRRALEVARSQQAKGWELRAAMGLARLWQSQGKRQEAHDLLAPIYGWFTEGFNTKDLKEARVLLDELDGLVPDA